MMSKALAKARAFPGLAGMDLAKVVSAKETYAWTEGEWTLGKGYASQDRSTRFHVVAYDFGVKRNILRMLAAARLQADRRARPDAGGQMCWR